MRIGIAGLVLRLTALLFTLAAFEVSAAGHDNVIAAWVQYTPAGAQARVVARYHCPAISLDGEHELMTERAESTPDHPNNVCTAALPPGVSRILVADRWLPAPSEKRPRRVVVVGDTGCRLSEGHGLYQECNNSSLWPFAEVAKAIAAYQPDLIIYTGDYIYRESPCPIGDNGCAGSPYGDNEATWRVDWLDPAAPIHAAAPMVLVRGNHETCSRAGMGWFRYLDARPFTGDCADTSDPWVAKLNSLQVAVMDVANTSSPQDGTPLDGLFAEQLQTLDAQLVAPAWLAAHRTFWGYGADDDSGELTTPTSELQDAVRQAGMPDTIRLLIGAHIHLAEVLDFGGERPPQLVVANGGTQLVPRVAPPLAIDGVAIEDSQVLYQYGFVTLEAKGRDTWSIGFRDKEGRELEQCTLRDKRVSCKRKKPTGK